jgi:hypothetical protein
MKVTTKIVISVLFIPVVLCLFLLICVVITQIKIFMLKKDILLRHSNVISVELLGNEDHFDLDGGFLIKFDDGGWMFLSDVTFAQDRIIFDSCNGYYFLIYSRALTEPKENEEYLYLPYAGTDEPQPYGSGFTALFYEKLLDISFKNIDDFVKAYKYFSTYLNNTEDISTEKYNNKVLYSNWVWNPDEGLKKTVLDFDGEFFEYVIFKKFREKY